MDFLTTGEAAKMLRLPEGTLRYWRHVGAGPRSARLGRRVVYTRADIDAWTAQQFANTGRGGTELQRRAA